MTTSILVRWKLAGLFVFVIGLAAARAASAATLSGTVYGGSTPLASTLVEALTDGTTTVAASSTTAANGQYSMTLADGTYDLRVSPPAGSGFGQEIVQNVTISGVNRSYDVVLLSAQLGSLSGTVRGRNGQPIPNVNINAYFGVSYAFVRTDAQGQYSLQVGNGSVSIQFNGSGAAGIAPPNLRRPLRHRQRPATLDINVPVVSLSGRVLDPGGAGVQGAGLYLSANQYPSYGRDYSSVSATTDTQGGHTALLTGGSINATANPPAGSALIATNASFTLNTDGQQGLHARRSGDALRRRARRNSQPIPNVNMNA